METLSLSDGRLVSRIVMPCPKTGEPTPCFFYKYKSERGPGSWSSSGMSAAGRYKILADQLKSTSFLGRPEAEAPLFELGSDVQMSLKATVPSPVIVPPARRPGVPLREEGPSLCSRASITDCECVRCRL